MDDFCYTQHSRATLQTKTKKMNGSWWKQSWLILLFWGCYYPVIAEEVIVAGAAKEESAAAPGSNLLTWLLDTHHAHFDLSSQHVQWEDDDASSSRVVVFAKTSIPQGHVLATIPWSAILAPTSDEEEGEAHFHCGTAKQLWNELQSQQSQWAPYSQHIQSQPSKYRLPSQYSDAGKELLLEVLGGEDSGVLLMERPVQYAYWDWKVLCGVKTDESSAAVADETVATTNTGIQAAMWVQQHAFQDHLIPLRDWYTHRNGHYINVEIRLVFGEHAQIVARRDIHVGEQLHSSYTDCDGCSFGPSPEDRKETYGTPELFRDHGIIEPMPQVWAVPETELAIPFDDEDGEQDEVIMRGLEMKFQLVQNDDDDGIRVEFLGEEIVPTFYPFIYSFFRLRIQELYRLKNIEYPGTHADYGIPVEEWDRIWEFHQAYAMALKRAVSHLHQLIVEHGLGVVDDRPQEFGRVLDHWEDHYTDFQVELDHFAYNDAECDSSEWVDFFSYDEIERERSNYQEMLWQYRAQNDDTCLHLDGMLQICSSYRPHYHEFFVHFPARYVQSVERVIFLGSGDAMLLHEILKYPSLKKVVGLELDQTITRKSFKHFKTQPHYDDPRVEWWYGDATKTLPLLPRDYWGSFDLLLVDLSETVVSLHVTGKHDVLDVISMLLKPEGVMLENELYIDKMSRHFDNSVHIFYGSPKVCVQVHTVSSNSVDFLHSTIYDHGVDTHLIGSVEKPSDRFRFIHDFIQTNATSQGKCSDADDLTTTEYGRSAGIMLVVEAEKCAIPLHPNLVEAKLYEVLESQGLSPISSKSPSGRVSSTIQVVLKEGYVVARVWPEFGYVALDLVFWGAFSKMDIVKAALTEALRSETVSSYRVVVGGMHGSSTWEQDQDEIGIQFSQKRNCSTPEATDAIDEDLQHIIAVSIDETLDLLSDSEDLVIGVLCGQEDDEDSCVALQVLTAHPQVDTVIAFFACDDMPSFNFGDDDFDPMYKCERRILKRLHDLNAAEDNYSMDAFIVDLSASLSMLQVFASIWSLPEHRYDWMERPYVMATPYQDDEAKRKRFLDIIRQLGHPTISTMADFSIGSIGWRVFMLGDRQAVNSISEMETSLQSRLQTTSIQVRLLEGGQLHTEDDLMLEERKFRPEDYDYAPNQQQMQEQRPLGRQTVFQFEKQNDESISMPTMDELVIALAKALIVMEYTLPGEDAIPTQWLGVGDGAVATSTFHLGDVAMLWDGISHVDINIFVRNEAREIADQFLERFLDFTENRLTPSLRDDQPRGIGRVVNFQSDITSIIDHESTTTTSAAVK